MHAYTDTHTYTYMYVHTHTHTCTSAPTPMMVPGRNSHAAGGFTSDTYDSAYLHHHAHAGTPASGHGSGEGGRRSVREGWSGILCMCCVYSYDRDVCTSMCPALECVHSSCLVCVTRTHAHAHTRTNAHKHICIHAYIHGCTFSRIYAWHTHTFSNISACMHLHACTYV